MSNLKTITVTGNGVVYSEPDIAIVMLGVEYADADLAKAFDATASAMDATVKGLQQSGITDQDIRTTGLNVYNREIRPDGSEGPLTQQFVVRNSVRAIVRDIKQLGDILDRAVTNGANQVGQLTFEMSNRSALESFARKAAMLDAKQKAEELAAAVDMKVGKAITIDDQTYSPTPEADLDASVAHFKRSAMPVQGGARSITAQVQVVFRLK